MTCSNCFKQGRIYCCVNHWFLLDAGLHHVFVVDGGVICVVPLDAVWHAAVTIVVAEGWEVILWARVTIAWDESSALGGVVVSVIVGLKLGQRGSGSQIVAFVLFWEGAGFLTIQQWWVGLWLIGSQAACAEWVWASACWAEAIKYCGVLGMFALVLAVGLVTGSFFLLFCLLLWQCVSCSCCCHSMCHVHYLANMLSYAGSACWLWLEWVSIKCRQYVNNHR